MAKNPPAIAGALRYTGSIPGSENSPAGGHSNPKEPGGLRSIGSQMSEMTERLSTHACTSYTTGIYCSTGMYTIVQVFNIYIYIYRYSCVIIN